MIPTARPAIGQRSNISLHFVFVGRIVAYFMAEWLAAGYGNQRVLATK
jgi:hypothetical protein